MAAGISGCENSGLGRNMAAVPERSHRTTTRSECRHAMTLAQMPPPECPQSAHGTVGMQTCHDVGPDAAAGMSPKRPRHGCDFRMAGLGGKIIERFEKCFFRTMAREIGR